MSTQLEVSVDQLSVHPLWPDRVCIKKSNGQYISIADDLTVYEHQDALDKEAFVRAPKQPSTAYTIYLAYRRDGVVHLLVWPK